jgi:hypothetical protein
MSGHSRLAAMPLCLVLGFAGCASPPNGDVRLAKATLDKAVAAGAEDYAVRSFEAARQAQLVLDTELKVQAARWFKSYDKATELAVEAQMAADKAAADAVAGKAAAMTAAVAGATANGQNLFQNGNFTDGLAGWSVHPDSDSTVTVDLSNPAEPAWHVQYRKGNWSVIYQELALRPDTPYVYEATVKSTAPIVALYWQAETGRYHEIDKAYPEWTRLRYVFMTPHWDGQPYRTGFNPVLMKGPGEAWIKDLRLSQFRAGQP